MKGHLAAAQPFQSVSLRLSTDDEACIAPVLERLSATFEGSLGIGSYPVRLLSSLPWTQSLPAAAALSMSKPRATSIACMHGRWTSGATAPASSCPCRARTPSSWRPRAAPSSQTCRQVQQKYSYTMPDNPVLSTGVCLHALGDNAGTVLGEQQDGHTLQ